jgi:hypothetical protein
MNISGKKLVTTVVWPKKEWYMPVEGGKNKELNKTKNIKGSINE